MPPADDEALRKELYQRFGTPAKLASLYGLQEHEITPEIKNRLRPMIRAILQNPESHKSTIGYTAAAVERQLRRRIAEMRGSWTPSQMEVDPPSQPPAPKRQRTAARTAARKTGSDSGSNTLTSPPPPASSGRMHTS